MKIANYIFAALVLFMSFSQAFAEKKEVYEHRFKGAVKGVDGVAYYSLPPDAKSVKGSKEFTYEWKGATWRFANAKNRDKFIENPEAYAPQYGGYCAFAVSHGFTTSPRPDSWKIVDGKLYLNNNKRSFVKWEQDYENKIAKADSNWPAVLKK